MSSYRITAVFAVLAVMGLLALTFCARAHAADLGKGEWFRSLKQPITGNSCCDIADCAQAESKWVNGHWMALLRQGWRIVPDDKVLKNKMNIMERAVVCQSATSDTIYCFVPPDMGT